MSDNKLDQFFKDKLENASPTDFNPQHWEAARQLLKKEKKNHQAWWIFPLGALVILSLGWYLLFSLKREVPNSPTAHKSQEMALITLDETTMNNNLIDQRSEDQGRVRADATDGEVATKKLNSDQTSILPSLANRTRSLTKKKESISVEAASNSENRQLSDFPKRPSSGLKGHTAIESLNHKTENDVLDQPNGKTIQSEKVASLESIDQADFILNYDYPLSARYSALKITREKFNRRRYAWSGTLLLNPANSSGSTIQGLLLGFTYEKYVHPHWFLGTKPSMQLQTNQNGFSKFEQVTTYGFSAINTTYGLQADNLQFFSAPIYLAAESGKHTLELGVSLDLLLGARGKLQQISVEDQSVITVEDLGSGWIETTDMRKLTTNLFLGYKASIHPRLKTGITFFYNPGKLYPGLPNSLPQAANAKWYLGWQANYYIK